MLDSPVTNLFGNIDNGQANQKEASENGTWDRFIAGQPSCWLDPKLLNLKADGLLANHNYWKIIPGANFFIPYDKIASLNIRYEMDLIAAVTRALKDLRN